MIIKINAKERQNFQNILNILQKNAVMCPDLIDPVPLVQDALSYGPDQGLGKLSRSHQSHGLHSSKSRALCQRALHLDLLDAT